MNKQLLKRKRLLMDVLSIQTTSGNEFDMIAYIHKFCRENVPQAKVEIKDSNIYVTKGHADTYPCIVAHTDTVHEIHKYYKVFDDDNCLFAFNSESGKQVGVGGDDKVGIWLALEMLMTRKNIKCVFFHSEEIGCVGSSQADMEWFKDVGYCLQGDRRGSTDFVNNISGKLFSKAFSKTIAPILKHHGYKETSGAITDVGQLAENGIGVCVANMSCGYYDPHSDTEIVEFYDANNCLDMIENIVNELGCNKYEYQFTTSYGYGYGTSKWGDFSGASRGYWYGNNGQSSRDKEVIYDDQTGIESCYYCHCEELMDSEFTDETMECRYCPDCCSDILVEMKDVPNSNQIEMALDENEEDMNSWNKSFGVKEIDYEDVSDNYDGSMKHKSIVNEYLTNYQNK